MNSPVVCSSFQSACSWCRSLSSASTSSGRGAWSCPREGAASPRRQETVGATHAFSPSWNWQNYCGVIVHRGVLCLWYGSIRVTHTSKIWESHEQVCVFASTRVQHRWTLMQIFASTGNCCIPNYTYVWPYTQTVFRLVQLDSRLKIM